MMSDEKSAAGRRRLDVVMLERRLGELGADGLARELRESGEELLAEAVERSAAALERDPGQLAGQLAGRLGGRLRASFFKGRAGAWWRPLTVSLEPPRSPLRATLAGHGDEIRAVLVTPDGRTLLSSAEDGRVLRWDLESGEMLGELRGHSATVNAMAWTPAGDRLLTASDDCTIGVWDTADWRLVGQLRGHTGFVRRALANAAGLVVSGSRDGTIRVWVLESFTPLRVIEGHRTAISALTLLEGGTRVAAASTNNLLAVWDIASGERVTTLFDGSAGYRGEVMGLTLSRSNDSGIGHRHFPSRVWQGPDGALYSAESELVRWDLSTGGQALRGGEHSWPINDVAVTPELLATASSTVRLLEHDGTTRATLYGHERHVTAVGFSPDGRTLVSGGNDHTVRVWDVETALQAPAPPRHSGWIDSITPAPDGLRCATHTSDGLVHLWDLATGAHVRAFGHEEALLSAVCFTPDGSRLVVTTSRGHLWVWDVESGERVATTKVGGYWFKHLAPLRDGVRMLTGAVSHKLAIWDVQRGGEPEYFGGSMHVTGLVLTPDERLAVVTTYEMNKPGTLQVWDVEGRAQLGVHRARGESSFAEPLLADAGRLAVVADDKEVLVLALPEATPVRAIAVTSSWVARLVKLSEARVLAGCVEAEGKRVALREVDGVRGEVVREVIVELDRGQEPELRGLSVTPDGRQALVVADWCARLVDLESGRQIARFVGDAKIVSGVIRPDGAGALVGEEGGRVHVLALAGA